MRNKSHGAIYTDVVWFEKGALRFLDHMVKIGSMRSAKEPENCCMFTYTTCIYGCMSARDPVLAPRYENRMQTAPSR